MAIQILKEKGLYDSLLCRRAVTLASLCDIVAWLGVAVVLPKTQFSSWIISHWIVLAFFVGLGLKIDLISLFDLWTFIEIFVVAVIAKSLGTYLLARGSGENHRFSWNLAAILNARGAMEVLAAHYAYSTGIIDGPVFAALVLLGIVTSLMAVPAVRA